MNQNKNTSKNFFIKKAAGVIPAALSKKTNWFMKIYLPIKFKNKIFKRV